MPEVIQDDCTEIKTNMIIIQYNNDHLILLRRLYSATLLD